MICYRRSHIRTCRCKSFKRAQQQKNSELRILHTSHTGLPDPRIEKTANTMATRGHELFFLGGRETKYQSIGAFEKTIHCPIGNDLDVAINPRVRKKWIQTIDLVKPDVVHAHNIITARFLLDTGYAVIYDDHEYWSKQVFKYWERKMPRGLSSLPLVLMIPHWEREILERYPVITVSEGIAKEHRASSSHVFITKNYPSLAEVEHIVDQKERSGLVYIGNDFKRPKFLSHRNMAGLDKVIEFDILSGLSHHELMTRLTHYEVGLTPWRQHPFHMYSDPNKHYEYLNAGLQVLVTDSLYHPFENERYVHSFSDYEEIPALVNSLEDISGSTIMDHAKKNYIWEQQEQKIVEAYHRA